MLNAEPVYYDIYPDFAPRAERIEAAITPRTKAIIISNPSNPTGYAMTQGELDQVIELARAHNLFVIYDEIYSCFSFDRPHAQCLGHYDNIILLNGFSKSGGVPGWRVGFVIAPKALCAQMLKVQQYTFVCAHSASQWAMLEALDVDFSEKAADYKKKRDFIVKGLRDNFELVAPSGAFYIFPKAPWGTGEEFVEKCIENNLLIIPGKVFSRVDTHFRVSFSAPMSALERGVEVLNRVAKQGR